MLIGRTQEEDCFVYGGGERTLSGAVPVWAVTERRSCLSVIAAPYISSGALQVLYRRK